MKKCTRTHEGRKTGPMAAAALSARTFLVQSLKSVIQTRLPITYLLKNGTCYSLNDTIFHIILLPITLVFPEPLSSSFETSS